MEEALCFLHQVISTLGLFMKELFAHHGLNCYHQLFHDGVLFFVLLSLVLVLGLGFETTCVLGISSFETICFELFTSQGALEDFPINFRSLLWYHLLHLFMPWHRSIVALVLFLCVPKYLCYLHMENHALGETLALRLILQPWAIPDL
jgi:hypothetical protein